MIDILDLDVNNFTRNIFFEKAMECIDDLIAENKLPVIVGGTHYYTETLLFN